MAIDISDQQNPPSMIATKITTITQIIREFRLLLGAITGLIIVISGLIATDLIQVKIGDVQSAPPSSQDGLDGDQGYEIVLTKPEMKGEYSNLLVLQGEVRGWLGRQRIWVVLVPQDGEHVGKQIVLAEIKPSISNNTWNKPLDLDYEAREFQLSLVVADESASGQLELRKETQIFVDHLPKGARIYESYLLQSP